MTGRGGEGMVVPPGFVARAARGLVQPAVKCRGREYLRIIYGPEYTLPDNLARLRSRGLATKRSLALREFALGIEALERFVRHEPLRRVHECVFGVLAMESRLIRGCRQEFGVDSIFGRAQRIMRPIGDACEALHANKLLRSRKSASVAKYSALSPAACIDAIPRRPSARAAIVGSFANAFIRVSINRPNNACDGVACCSFAV